jgi:hypothetical protein
MDAYILGRHDGELPTHLLSGPGGDRVRAMARLAGPAHDVFYALEVADERSVTVLTESLTASGLVVSETHMPLTSDPDKYAIVGHIRPSHFPPWDFYLFIHGDEVEDLPNQLSAAADELNEGTVGFAIDASGKVLIELGSNDEAKVNAVAASLVDALGGTAAAHTVVGDGIIAG